MGHLGDGCSWCATSGKQHGRCSVHHFVAVLSPSPACATKLTASAAAWALQQGCTHRAASVCLSVCLALSTVLSLPGRLYFQGRPMEDGLAEAIDEGRVGPRDEPKVRGKILTDEFGWDKELAKKIW